MSYISSLNLIHVDSSAEAAAPADESFTDELSLWANAQFTFNNTSSSIIRKESDDEEHGTERPLPQDKAPETNYTEYLLSHLSSSDGLTSSLPRLAPALPGTNIKANRDTPVSSNINKKHRPETENSNTKLIAEEDKRRRNTAASARFRMKKKLREQALEKTAKEITDKAEILEKKVKELEMEAKWLRALVTEKDPKLLKAIEDAKIGITY